MADQPPTSKTESAAPPVNSRIARDLPCVHCDYNLRGLARTGTCPECGTEIRIGGARLDLAAAPLDWLQRLQRGCQHLIGVGVCAPITWFILKVANGFWHNDEFSILGFCIQIAALFVAFVNAFYLISGLRLLSSPDPRPLIARRARARRVFRASLLLLAGWLVSCVLMVEFEPPGGPALLYVLVALSPVGLPGLSAIISYAYMTSELLTRGGNRRAARNIRRTGWLAVLGWGLCALLLVLPPRSGPLQELAGIVPGCGAIVLAAVVAIVGPLVTLDAVNHAIRIAERAARSAAHRAIAASPA